MKSTHGFTLTELLIALVILGEIATFTIPKILNSQQNAKKAAIFKETLSSLESLNINAVQMKQITVSNYTSYMLGTLNAIKICPNAAITEGCVSAAAGLGDDAPGVVLPNGAVIWGLDSSGNDHGGGEWSNTFHIDWNGNTGPNLVGNDIIDHVRQCYGTANCTTSSGSTIKPGQIRGDSASDQTQYNALFN